MNYALKTMAIVFALGVLILQGCQTRKYSNTSYPIENFSDNRICYMATENNKWSSKIHLQIYVNEAKNRSLYCGVSNKVIIASKPNKFSKLSNATICNFAKVRVNWDNTKYLKEARRRNLDCSLKDKKTITASKQNQKNNIDIQTIACALMPSGHCRFLKKSNEELCEYIIGYKRGVTSIDNYSGSFNEAKRRGLTCGDKSKNKTIIASKAKTQTYTKPITSTAELDAERKKRIELERKLAAMEAKQKQEQQRIDTDTRVPILEIISNETRGKRGTIYGIARDNVEVAEVTVNGKPISLSSNGKFKFTTYVPPTGKKLKVEVTDIAGLTSSKTITLKGNREIVDSTIAFDDLNPLGKRVKFNKNGLALIVGVSNYENTKAKALYADNDAMVFKDYASEKLGIPENRIKILVNDRADERDILLSVQEWLRRSAKPNKSDIYVFFAGHGLASQDGKNMYLLPHDGSPRLLDDTAILRDRLFTDLKATNPKSVTVFLDTCYSGVTRNEEMLIAGRPIVIKAKEQAIPEGFTLFSAASNEQISRPLEEAKHGMFSYFLMKGMEGDADANNDNKITARELHAYVEQNVVQQSSGSQTPELQGDKDRVLVQFN